MTKRFMIVAEDELGRRLVGDLLDRVVAERSDDWLRDLWSDKEIRASQRVLSGLSPDRDWSTWGDVKRLADRHGIRTHGIGMKAERAMAKKAVNVAALRDAPDALVLVHDTDGDPEKRTMMVEGARPRADGEPPFPVLVAAPHPESEAWVLAGASPLSTEEKEKHEAERARLGFDPVKSPERLTSHRATDKRDAKRACAAILGEDQAPYERWDRCWKETPLDVLEENGRRAGLAEYLNDVEETIVPLFDLP